jgi:phosphotransacetylase/acyl dehydratase
MSPNVTGTDPEILENRTLNELAVGDSACLVRQLSEQDIQLFAVMSGDVNPAHVDQEFAHEDIFHKVIAHGMWGGALISNVLGTQLPGPGTIYLAQDLRFKRPIGLGDTITVTVEVTAKDAERGRVTLACRCVNQDGNITIEGEATVLAPQEKIRRNRVKLPEVSLNHPGRHLWSLIESAQAHGPLTVAVVHPVDTASLLGALRATEAGLIEPVLVGPEARIREAAQTANIDISGYRLETTAHSHAAAECAASLAAAGEVQAIMKGKLHTDELMGAVLARNGGLRTERRASHVFYMDVPGFERPIFITDAAINIAPTLDDKKDIVQNAIDLARATGIEQPKVAILSAVETVASKMGSTVEAAALAKMADRGQITGGLVDGPLAFDNAINVEAARTKGITSPVAGHADILVAPDLEAANMAAKQLTYMANAKSAGIVMGTRVPIALTSRADDELGRMASSALAVRSFAWQHKLPEITDERED